LAPLICHKLNMRVTAKTGWPNKNRTYFEIGLPYFCSHYRYNHAVFEEVFSMIISVVAAKLWYLKNVRFLLGHPSI